MGQHLHLEVSSGKPVLLALAFTSVCWLTSCHRTAEQVNTTAAINASALVAKYLGEDTTWYLQNIPFFECSDKELEAVYYYRWKLFKAHIRNVGKDKYVITEFINHVAWDRDPWCTINAASMHHIYEGRWLRNPQYLNGYIRYLLSEGGNNRSYTESVSEAAYARYLVNGDSAFLIPLLAPMKTIYKAWADHWDSTRNLYFIAAMPDATEYDIASIDASGGKAGFDGGVAFRPTINSYQYGNAMAIARIAMLTGDSSSADAYYHKASELKDNMQKYLWNPALHHFTDRYKEENQFVKNWDFIRGRELAGMAPWYFNLPDDNATFSRAWTHVVDSTYLLGQYGLRTNEPSYEYYFHQFVYFQGKRGSQWNGPSWPYQTSQTLTAMANLLNNYYQHSANSSDYLKILRRYARQHILPNGKLNLVENYDPNVGGPIVHYYWSNHYNHSTFDNLIITGLCGLRPSEGDSLTINPLTDDSIEYFMLQDISYHGHNISVVFDRSGSRYQVGKGLILFVDGKRVYGRHTNKGDIFPIGRSRQPVVQKTPENLALNITRTGYPLPSSSLTMTSDTSLYQSIDGRIWYFPEITNYWSTAGSHHDTDWLGIGFAHDKEVSTVKIYLVRDDRHGMPDSLTVEYEEATGWERAEIVRSPKSLIPNSENTFVLSKVLTRRIRVLFHHSQRDVAVTEIECY